MSCPQSNQKISVANSLGSELPVAVAPITKALSIRQPYVEQILQGSKTIEYRNRPTKVRGRVFLYASLTPGDLLDWGLTAFQPGELPTGQILGTVEIVACTGEAGHYQWHLANPERLPQPLKPKNHPQPAWFHPFQTLKK